MYPQLSRPAGLYTPKLPVFTHLDFLWAKDAKTLFVNDVIKILESFESGQTPNVKNLTRVNLNSITSKFRNAQKELQDFELLQKIQGALNKVKDSATSQSKERRALPEPVNNRRGKMEDKIQHAFDI